MAETPTHAGYQAFKRAGLKPTTPDILGPFWKDGAPERPDGKLCDSPALSVSGRVTDTDGQPLTATLDVWQADEAGEYDNAGFTLRGKVQTDGSYCEGGAYIIQTVRPGHYKISDPGQPDEFRCSHIHVIVTAPGYKRLVTQLYFADDPFDGDDHWFSPSRCLTPAGDGRERVTTRFTFDFVLAKE